MTYDENRKYFIDNAATLINKSILNYYDDKLKNTHINYDVKEILHRLYICLSSLYGDELGNINIQDLRRYGRVKILFLNRKKEFEEQ